MESFRTKIARDSNYDGQLGEAALRGRKCMISRFLSEIGKSPLEDLLDLR